MEMDTNDYYALLGPFFLLVMGVEAWAARRLGRKVYGLADTLANLSCGVGQVLMGVFTGAFLLALYRGFGDWFGVVNWSVVGGGGWGWVGWVLAFVGVDFCYYWFHRASHGVHLLWAIHVVHHQSEEMNISVALRQPWFSDITALLFFWPLPLLGVPLEAFFFAVGCLSLYEASLHTELVRGRGGLWGKVFNMPAHHRLHHASEAVYLDKNFGSTLILWDRLFGTFVEQSRPEQALRYGTVEPLASHNPLWAQWQPALGLWRKVQAVKGWRAVIEVLWRPPGWVPPGVDVSALRCERAQEGGARGQARSWYVGAYALLQAVLLGVGAVALLLVEAKEGVSVVAAAALVALILWGTAAVGGILEGKAWARRTEVLRVAVVCAVLVWSFY